MSEKEKLMELLDNIVGFPATVLPSEAADYLLASGVRIDGDGCNYCRFFPIPVAYCPNCGRKIPPVKVNYTESICDSCANDPCDADSMASCMHGRNVDGVGDYRRREDNGN